MEQRVKEYSAFMSQIFTLLLQPAGKSDCGRLEERSSRCRDQTPTEDHHSEASGGDQLETQSPDGPVQQKQDEASQCHV